MTNETFTLDGRTVTLHFYKHPGKASKTRIYVEGTEPDYPHPPYSVKGEDPANDEAWRVYNRDEIKAMRVPLRDVQEVLDDYGRYGQGRVRLSFSRNAGCSACPCSPGFIADRALYSHDGRRIDAITVKA